jgi:flavodoxin
MKALIVYFSRSGVTKKVAGRIAELLGCDLQEIVPVRGYSGLFGYLRAAIEIARKRLPEIHALERSPGDYDLVVVGTPVWANTMASPVRSFFSKYHDELKRVSLFATKGGDRTSRFAKDVEKFWNITAAGTVELQAKNVKKDTNFKNIGFPALADFVKTITS